MKDGMGSGFSVVVRRTAVAVLLAAFAVGCGSSQSSTPNDPTDPPLDTDHGGGVTPASSARVQEGIDALQAGEFAAAKAVLSEAAKDDPKDPQAAYYLGQALEGLGDAEGAEAEYRRATELDPNFFDAIINLTGLLIDTERGAEALPMIEAALQKVPDDKDLLLNHALALEASGDMGAAIAAYAKAVEKSPDDVELRVAFIQVLAGEKRVDEAKAQVAKVKGVKDPLLARALAQIEAHLGMFNECVALLDPLLTSNPTPDLHMSRATCRYGKGDQAGAEADYRAATELDPNFAAGYFYLGVLLEKQGKKDKAKEAFKKAAEVGKGTDAEKAALQKLKTL